MKDGFLDYSTELGSDTGKVVSPKRKFLGAFLVLLVGAIACLAIKEILLQVLRALMSDVV